MPYNNIIAMSSALVIFSGGQDSTTCLFWAKSHFEAVHAVTFDYGQRHRNEIEAARNIAAEANIPIEVLKVPLIGTLGHNALTDATMPMDATKPADKWPNTFVPGRNLFFASIAAIRARELGIHNLVMGVSQTDYSGYPDCRDTFVRSLNVTLNLAMDEQFVIHTPLMWLTKEETWALADRLGIFDLVRTQTVTCYNGVPGNGCGHCPACQLRQRSLENYLKQKDTH